MVLSDDKAETFPLSVSKYHFVDEKNDPVSFSVLPIQWSKRERIGGEKVKVFLFGNAYNEICKRVIAWKFELSNEKPKISVLSEDNHWITLKKPRKRFADIVRSILITVHCLHFLMRNHEASGRSLWSHILKRFSLHEVKPFESELADHLCLISDAFRRNDALAKSKFLVQFLNKNPKKRKVLDKDDIVDVAEEDKFDESHDLYDDVCAFCDEGGNLLCCEGRCLRSFHATMESAAAEKSHCDSLGLTQDEVDAIPNFLCKNCEYKQHQCFICGVLGCSDTSSGAQVFSCASATCGRFYHPHCVSKLLHRDDKDSAKELEKKIAEGRSFTCPIHKCCICKQGENRKDPSLQFAVCRRCPKSYHRKCLPKKIAFKENKKEGIVRRAWKDLLLDQILIYCLDHEIDERLGTPTRNHIKFPDVEDKNRTKKQKTAIEEKKRKHDSSSKSPGDCRKSKTRVLASEERDALEPNEKPSSAVKVGENKDIGELFSETNIPVKVHGNDASKKDLKSPMGKQNECVLDKSAEVKTVPSQLDAETQRRLLDLVEDVESSIKLEGIRKKYGVLSTRASPLKDVVNRTISMEKVQSSVEVVGTALQILEEGGSIEDAKAVCEPELLGQIFNWKIVNKLYCYVQEGDMVVDICCGDNDFNLLMKQKLQEMGKKCLYRNYDLVQAKNDVNSEKRDWMTVQGEELATGSRLIMGLNLPSGVKAAVANKFIDKALEFKPKLLLLIFPREEAQRLDEKTSSYDLVWEDHWFLSGKSFYLSVSVDSKEKQIDESNLKPRLLYLWSRVDWSAKHKYIAEKYGRDSLTQEPIEKSRAENLILDHPMSDHDNCDTKSKSTNEIGRHESRKSPDHKNNRSNEQSGAQWNDTKKHGREKVRTTKERGPKMSPNMGLGGRTYQNFRNRLSSSPMEKLQQNDTMKHAETKVKDLTQHESETCRPPLECVEHSHPDFGNCMSASPMGNQRQNDAKGHGKAKVEAARKSEMSPQHSWHIGNSHLNFGNRKTASPMEQKQNDTREHGRAKAETPTKRKLEMNPPRAECGGHNRHQNFGNHNHGKAKVEAAIERKSEMSPPHSKRVGRSHLNFGYLMSSSPMKRQQNDTKEHERANVERATMRKLEMKPPDAECGGHGRHQDFGNRMSSSPGEKRARTSDDKFRRHNNRNGADHETEHHKLTYSLGDRQHVIGNEENHRKESNIRTPISHHEQKDSCFSGSIHHNQKGSLALNSPSSGHPISIAEPSYPAVRQPLIHYSEFALGLDKEYSRTHSAGWLEHDE